MELGAFPREQVVTPSWGHAEKKKLVKVRMKIKKRGSI